MRTKTIGFALSAVLFALCVSAQAQQPKKVFRIGYLSNARPGGNVTGMLIANVKRITGFALKSRLPSMYVNREFADVGGLMSYGADLADSDRLVAWYVDKILKGSKPADLPVEQPKKFELVINLKTANQIGLTIPQSLLYRADKVIK
jgi:ABC transporter substrate binding protein